MVRSLFRKPRGTGFWGAFDDDGVLVAARVETFRQNFPEATIGGTYDILDNTTVEQVLGHADAAALLQRLLDNSLSRWEPDPVAALAAIEARAVTAS